MKVNVYVDGFNLYYGSVKGTPHKWLDFSAPCRLMLPRDHINRIRYFTAKVKPLPNDPDQPQLLPVGLLCPQQNRKKVSRELLSVVSFHKLIREGALSAGQFPPIMQDRRGQFTKPPGW